MADVLLEGKMAGDGEIGASKASGCWSPDACQRQRIQLREHGCGNVETGSAPLQLHLLSFEENKNHLSNLC